MTMIPAEICSCGARLFIPARSMSIAEAMRRTFREAHRNCRPFVAITDKMVERAARTNWEYAAAHDWDALSEVARDHFRGAMRAALESVFQPKGEQSGDDYEGTIGAGAGGGAG